MPGNDYQVLSVPITPGMREDIHRHAGAPPGTLRYAQNVRWGALGAAERRNGTTEIPTTVGAGTQFPLSSASFPVELLTGADVTFAGKDGVAYAARPADGGWRFAGRYSSAEPRPGRVDLNRAQTGQITADSQATAAISTAGNRLFAYTISAPAGSDQLCVYTLQDANGNTIESETIPNARRCRAVSTGTDIFLIVQRWSSNAVDVYRSAAGGAITLLGAAIVTLDASGDSWDVAAWTSTHWVFAALDSSSTTVTVRRMSGATTDASTTQSASMRSTSRITIFADTDHVWLGWNDNTVSDFARITCWNWTGAAFSATFSANSIDAWTATDQKGTPPIIGTGPSATQVRVVNCIHNQGTHATPDAYTWQSSLVATTGIVSNQTAQYHGIPASKPFGPSGQYIWADLQVRRTPGSVAEAPIVRALMRCRDYSASNDFKYVVDLVGYKQAEAEASFTPLFDGAGDWWWMPAATPDGTYFSLLPINVVGSNFATGLSGLTRYFSFREFAINATLERRDSAMAAGALNVAGQPCAVVRSANVRDQPVGDQINTDGVELGFHRGPVIRSLTASNGAGSLTNNGVYSYVAVYRFVDGAGRVHRSPPSAPVQVTLGAADDTVLVSVATCEMQRALCTITSAVEVYRTEAGGITYHLVSDTLENDVTALSVQASDQNADSAIVDNRILYTALQVPNDMAPACRWLRASETRLWAAGLWDPTLIQASKIIVPEEPPLWSDLDTFKVRIPKPCTGLAFQDGVLLAFTATDVYAIGTDGGPGNDGLDSFADARLVCPGIGCEDARSIVETPAGVIFRSRRGFELMPRGLGAVQPLPGIETQLETYTEVISSTLHVDERATTAQFLMRGDAASGFDTIAFDAQTSGGTGAPGSAFSFSHTLAAGSNRLVKVGVSTDLLTGTVTSVGVTYGGLAMTQITSNALATSTGVYVFGMLDASLTTGSNTVEVTIGGGVTGNAHAYAESFTGVDQTLPTNFAGSSGSSAAASVGLTTTAANAWIVDAVSGAGGLTTGTPGGSQTERVESNTGGGSTIYSSTLPVASPGAQTMSWTFSASQLWHTVALELKPAAIMAEGTRVLVFDLDRQAWSVDTYPVGLSQIATGVDGRLLLASDDSSVSPAFLAESASAKDDDAVFFQSKLTYHDIYPFGVFKQGDIRNVLCRADAQGTCTLNVDVGVDGATARTVSNTFASATTFEAYRGQTPAQTSCRGTSVQLSTYDTSSGDAASGVTFYGLAIIVQDKDSAVFIDAANQQ